MTPIEINQLTFCYGSKPVLQDVSLSIPPGLFGLLGRNGAGKTTLMRIIVGLLPIRQGSVLIGGVSSQDKAARRQMIGYLPQDFDFYPGMSVQEALEYLAVLDGLDRSEMRQRINQLLDLVQLKEARKKPIRALSGGMKRRLGIAQSLLSDPPVLIVDEPTAGLDPEERIRFRHLLSELAQDKTILVSTHIASDLESSSSRLGIIDQGRVVFQGETSQLLDQTAPYTFEASIDRTELTEFKKRYLIYEQRDKGDSVLVRFLHHGIPEATFLPVSPSLEAAYLHAIHSPEDRS